MTTHYPDNQCHCGRGKVFNEHTDICLECQEREGRYFFDKLGEDGGGWVSIGNGARMRSTGGK